MKRRDFLFTSASTYFMMNDLLSNVFKGILSDAYAATGSNHLKNYVCLFIDGGAEKHWFDTVLQPNGTGDTLGSGSGFMNYLTSVEFNKLAFAYRQTENKVGDYYLPYLWDSTLPTASGGTVEMKSLANNMAIIRGMRTGLSFDAHPHNKLHVLRPYAHSSVNGAVADINTDAPIAAIMSDATNSFKSQLENSYSKVGRKDNAYVVFAKMSLEKKGNPYSKSPMAFLGKSKTDQVVRAFASSLSEQMPTRKKQAFAIMMDNRQKAIEMLNKGFAGIEQDYSNYLLQYGQIVDRVMNPDSSRILAGLDDKQIKGDNLLFQFHSDNPGFYKTASINQGFNTATCDNLIHSLAKAEIYIKNNITTSMLFNIAGINKIGDQYSLDRPEKRVDSFDTHYMGAGMRTMVFSRFYQSLAGGLLHLRNKLSSYNGKNLWVDSLVHIKTEFNRGGFLERGTDHNIHGCSDSFFSGRINKLTVAGNIYGAEKGSKRCTGRAAPVTALGGKLADSKNAYSTVGALMGYETSQNSPPMLKLSSGNVVSNVENPKNLEDQ